MLESWARIDNGFLGLSFTLPGKHHAGSAGDFYGDRRRAGRDPSTDSIRRRRVLHPNALLLSQSGDAND